MKLTSLINHDLIKLGASVKSKEEVITLLVDEIYNKYNFKQSKEQIFNSVMEREKLGGTAFETGLSTPHGRLEYFNDIIIAICVPREPIIVESNKITMFVLLLTSKIGSKLYLQTLSTFAKISTKKELFNSLITSNNKSEFIDKISDVYVKKELLVEDIMSERILTLKQDNNLKELADLFYKHSISYAPIVDDDNNIIGEVTMNELLKVGIPNYALLIGNLNFVSSFEPFEELLKNEDKILIKDIMKKPSIKLTKGTSIVEAALELTQNGRRQLPVVEGNKIIGVLSYMDVLKKIIRK